MIKYGRILDAGNESCQGGIEHGEGHKSGNRYSKRAKILS